MYAYFIAGAPAEESGRGGHDELAVSPALGICKLYYFRN